MARAEVFALLRPNGAGKTTTLEILDGYRRRDGGLVEVLETGVLTWTNATPLPVFVYFAARVLHGLFVCALQTVLTVGFGRIARIFPVLHFVNGTLPGFVGTAFRWSDVLIVGIWGVAGLVLAVRFFSWEPRV